MAHTNGRIPGWEARAGRFPGPSLIPSLNAIQREHGWLPREQLVRLARGTRRPLYEIEGLISFYPHFRTAPPAKVEIAVCGDLSCWLHGADEQLARIRASYGDDTEVEVREVSCLGRCDRSPAAAVNERPAAASEVDERVRAARAGSARAGGAPSGGARSGHAPGCAPAPAWRHWPNDPYPEGGDASRYGVVRGMLAAGLRSADTVELLEQSGLRAMGATLQHAVGALKDSGLRGMGGAGFPTAAKWELVATQENEPKYVICNADESEPGTFKDRQILADQPYLVIEGMLAAMLAIGAEQGWVFIRHEYGPEEGAIRAELDDARAQGVLGENAFGSGRRLDIDVFTSPGGYILGEESALLECMEGHRGEPRNKPPFPATYGLWGKPTLMNSVETFAAVPIILERGGKWWREQGVRGGVGLKFFAVSGQIARPGTYCVPMGTTARELIELAGGVANGARLQAFQPGGASSSFLDPEQLDVPLDFKPLADAGSMLGSGALVVIAEGTSLLAAATNVLRFFRNESCGRCVPCRTGSHKAHRILTELLDHGRGADEVDPQIDQLEETMRLTSICGLGQVALGPVMSVLRLQRTGTRAPR